MIAVILTGGSSRRMGQPKAWLDIGGRSCIMRVRDACVDAGFAVEFQGDLPGVQEAFPANTLHPDPEAGQGPLAALATALSRNSGLPVFLVACDMPFLSGALLRGVAAALQGVDWAAPTAGGRMHPLCAAFGPAVLGPAQALLATGRRDMQAVLTHPELCGRSVPPESAWGDPDLLLMNVNTPDELAVARRLAGA